MPDMPMEEPTRLTFSQKTEIRSLSRQIVHLFTVANTDPMLAYTVLLNCMGSLIGTQMADDAPALIMGVQQRLPLYVEAYRSREKRIHD
jgi:hypothetical protein